MTPDGPGSAADEAPQAIAAITRTASVLTPPGTVVVEPSLDYSYGDQNRVLIEGYTILPALTIGLIDVRQVQRDTVVAALALRTGLAERWEVDVKVPYVYRADSTTSRELGTGSNVETTTDTSSHDLGDVEVGTRLQLTGGRNGWPVLISGLRFKTITGRAPYDVPVDSVTGLEQELPTGTGFYAVQPSLTALATSDPVVFFGTLSYTWNIERTVDLQTGGRSTIDPGDNIGASFGMGFALNERASFSLGYEHIYIRETVQDGRDLPDSDVQVGTLQLGFGYRLSESTAINLQVGAGLTEAAPDVRLTLRVPIRLQLF